MKYLRKFETETDVMMFVKPNVVLIGDTGSVLYNVELPNGVYIQHIDGNLLTTEQWTAGGFANEEANGVAVISDNARFVIAKTRFTTIKWSTEASAVEGVVLTNDKNTALADYSGATNTELIATIYAEGAANTCKNFTFPNGAKGYLPSLGELSVIYSRKTDITTAMQLIGGATWDTKMYWSSTQYSVSDAWGMYMNTGSSSYGSKTYSRTVLPLTTL